MPQVAQSTSGMWSVGKAMALASSKRTGGLQRRGCLAVDFNCIGCFMAATMAARCRNLSSATFATRATFTRMATTHILLTCCYMLHMQVWLGGADLRHSGNSDQPHRDPSSARVPRLQLGGEAPVRARGVRPGHTLWRHARHVSGAGGEGVYPRLVRGLFGLPGTTNLFPHLSWLRTGCNQSDLMRPGLG